jgi:hypothetical protein
MAERPLDGSLTTTFERSLQKQKKNRGKGWRGRTHARGTRDV